ncbi:hypothetical protein HY311_00420 [Candidatus Nomurabacteria bacterium]|nr:hypothetical protein [Candidatus Nomurabacteria bacterium]
MTIGGQPNDKKREAGITFQVGGEGISTDYANTSMMASMDSKTLLDMPNFRLADSVFPPEKLRTRILNRLKDFPSYTEYMSYKGQIDGIGLADFLTEKGKEIVTRLDEIALELRSLYVEDPATLNVERVFTLLQEENKLIYNRR